MAVLPWPYYNESMILWPDGRSAIADRGNVAIFHRRLGEPRGQSVHFGQRAPFSGAHPLRPYLYTLVGGRGAVNPRCKPWATPGAFRTLRLARDFVEIGSWFWLMGGGFWKMARLGNGMPYENTS